MLNNMLGLATNNFPDYKGPSLVSLFLYLVLFVIILGMAYFTTKLVSRNYAKNFAKNMEIIEKMPLGVDRNLMIVRVGEGHYLLSNDKTGIKKIDSLESFKSIDDQLVIPENIKTFKDILSKYRK